MQVKANVMSFELFLVQQRGQAPLLRLLRSEGVEASPVPAFRITG